MIFSIVSGLSAGDFTVFGNAENLLRVSIEALGIVFLTSVFVLSAVQFINKKQRQDKQIVVFIFILKNPILNEKHDCKYTIYHPYFTTK